MCKNIKYIKSIAAIIVVALLFFACSGKNVQQIKTFTLSPESPTAVIDTFEMLYSDSSIMRFRLQTPKLLMFSSAEEPYQEYPNGFFIEKFGSDNKITSSIRGDYGKYFEKKELWEARHNVIALTESGDSLLTDALFWDDRRNLIYSDIFVKVIRKDEILTGIGFEADVQMNYWKFNKPQGHFYLEMNEESEMESEQDSVSGLGSEPKSDE